ncbi:MAG: hypothetical protein M1831_007266 [Alyxoria varia]|nr:MAG: hypothetical protein M1831_007266 [Alyxoria varia]
MGDCHHHGRDRGSDGSSCAQDLHELVTLEPNNQIYTGLSLQARAELGSNEDVRRHSNRITSTTLVNASTNMTSTPAFASSCDPLSAAQEGEHDSESLLGLDSSSRVPHIQAAEKESDNLETPLQRRKTIQRNSASTSKALNRLFCNKSPFPSGPSREPSFNNQGNGFSYMRSFQSGTPSITDHLYNRAFLDGRHSDINIKAFGRTYPLHRIILDRAPFFASALSKPWLEASQKDVELHPEEIDSHITQEAFELAIKRLYGSEDAVQEDEESIGLFATGNWLEMQDVVDSSVDSIIRKMNVDVLPGIIQLVTSNYYGKPGHRILASAKAMLSRNGWEMSLKLWDGIPTDVIKEIVGCDGFFVSGEWERWILAKRLLNRRLKLIAREEGLWKAGPIDFPHVLQKTAIRTSVSTTTSTPQSETGPTNDDPHEKWLGIYKSSEIKPLYELLDTGINYVHLTFEQLKLIRSARDECGVPLTFENVISDSLWASMELRLKVLNASERDATLDLTETSMSHAVESPGHSTPEDAESSEYVKIPSTEAPDKVSPEAKSVDVLQSRKFWVPMVDCNIVVGGNSDPVVTPTHRGNEHTAAKQTWLSLDDVQNSVFGWDTHNRSPDEAILPSYSTFAPFRFSVEFLNPYRLKDKRRVYSRTIFYAGSLWNVYIQKLKASSKNPQLGVYLHRAKRDFLVDSSQDSYLSRCSVDERICSLESEIFKRSTERRRRQVDTINPEGQQRAQRRPDAVISRDQNSTQVDPGASLPLREAPVIDQRLPACCRPHDASPSSSDSSSDEEFTISPALGHKDRHDRSSQSRQPALPPYEDKRSTIKTYFKIYSPSKGGRMLSVYESKPDDFNFSQSWGWKSSTLIVDDDVVGGNGRASEGAPEHTERSLKKRSQNKSATALFHAGPSAAHLDPDQETVEVDRINLDDDRATALRGAPTSASDAKARAETKHSDTDGKLRFSVVLGVV